MKSGSSQDRCLKEGAGKYGVRSCSSPKHKRRPLEAWLRFALFFVLLAFVVWATKLRNSRELERFDDHTGRHQLAASIEPKAIVTVPVVFQGNEIDHGRAVFEGKGNCTTCHTTTSDRGKRRGPDLAGIGGRAAKRAKQFGLIGPHAGTQYLIDSIIRPSMNVIDGYIASPETWLPSGLTDADIRSVVIYLQSLGGVPNPTDVSLPTQWLAAKRQEYQRELKLFSFGDPEKGMKLFHNVKGKAGCVKCHKIDGLGKDTCPDLTTIASVQRPSYILESILNSSASIVRGYRQVIIVDIDGLVHTGLPIKEDDQSVTLVVDQDGKTEVVQKGDIEEQLESKVSQMPANFAEQLTAEQVMNLVAYLLKHEAATSTKLAKNSKPPATKSAGNTTIPALSLSVFDQVTEDQERYRMAIEKGDPIVGGRIYTHYCVMCHGLKGDGSGFNAANLATKPANHTDNRRMSKTDDLLIHGVITRGGMKTGRSFLMPPWSGNLTERERWDLIAYIRTLHADMPQ